jgi:hypothetical protein
LFVLAICPEPLEEELPWDGLAQQHGSEAARWVLQVAEKRDNDIAVHVVSEAWTGLLAIPGGEAHFHIWGRKLLELGSPLQSRVTGEVEQQTHVYC